MDLVAIGQWRKGVLWPTMIAFQLLYAACFILAICAGLFFAVLTGFAVVSTRIFVWLILVQTSKTVIAIVSVVFLVISYAFFQCVWYAMIICSATGSAIILLDTVYHEIKAWIHVCHAPPIGEVSNGGERVAAPRSASDGYHGRFHPVIICDGDQTDDPFWPDHASIMHCVEVRWHNMIWREVILWRLSLLNGSQWHVASFHTLKPFLPRRPFAGFDDRKFLCFQSHGVVFMYDCGRDRELPDITLTVLDTRFGKSAAYKSTENIIATDGLRNILLVRLCLRKFNSRGSVEGWRIQVLSLDGYRDDVGRLRWCLCNTLCDLRDEIIEASYEEITFGTFNEDWDPFSGYGRFRTRNGSFGMWVLSLAPGLPAIVFNPTNNTYRYYPTIKACERANICLTRHATVFCNEREVVQLRKKSCVLRAARGPATMKYSAVKALFRSHPSPLYRMTAAEFKRITGIDMEGQFPRRLADLHWVWLQIRGMQ